MTIRDRVAGKRNIPPLSIIRAIWKQKLLIAVVSLCLGAAGVAVVLALPAIYRSETLILVESQRIPEEFVKATVETNLQDRLSTLGQQIMSYTRLLEVVKQFDLYKKERTRQPEEQVIEMMRADIQVTMEKGWSRDRPGAFRIAYENEDPQVAARVANQLGNLFIEQNLRTREVQAVGTSEFLDTQLVEAAKRLQDQEAQLGVYKLKYSGELPQQENALIAETSRLQVQLQGVQEAMNRAQQSKVLTESVLSAAQESSTALEQMIQRAASPRNPLDGAPARVSSVPASEAIQRDLDALLTRYTESHPAVKATRDMLAKVKQREQEASAPPDPGEKPTADVPAAKPASRAAETSLPLNQSLLSARERIRSLQAQRDVTVQQLASLEKERLNLLKRIDAVQQSISKLPLREQELATVTRDYEISKANYQSILDKKLAAQMATEMERRQKSERFAILDAARVPEKPIKPNRPLFGSLSVLVALVLGVGLGLGTELRRGMFLGEWEMAAGVVILGRVPVIPEGEASGDPAIHRRKFRWFAAASVLLLVVAGAVGAGLYFRWFAA